MYIPYLYRLSGGSSPAIHPPHHVLSWHQHLVNNQHQCLYLRLHAYFLD